jgi:Zn-dependent protease with chaperone function
VVIACAGVYVVLGNQAIRIICVSIGVILTLLASGPSLLGAIMEQSWKGKPLEFDFSSSLPELRQLRQSMGIKKEIKVRIVPNWLNAEARFSTIEIGQPVLVNMDAASRKALIAHELGHIKGNHSLKMIPVIVAALILMLILSLFTPLGISMFTFLVPVAFIGIAIRFISWPLEYEADLIASQHTNNNGVISSLTILSKMRNTNATRDFYSHPSVDKRIANLSWSKQTRLKKWYIEL